MEVKDGENSQYKDSVFVDLFCDDIKGKENFLSLYNALHGTSLTMEEADIEPMKLEKVLYHKFYNDVSMRVGNRIIVLFEHQSTINMNMPLRCLIYVARLYEKMTDSKVRFATMQQPLAVPEFYVFYNGQDNVPLESELKLSDAFRAQDKDELKKLGADIQDFALELKVKVFNINEIGAIDKIKSCKPLCDYVELVNIVRSHKESGRVDYMESAIKEAIDKGILADYLTRKGSEVVNMLFAEYDYDTDIAVQRAEALQQGMRRGMVQMQIENAKNLLKMKLLSHEQIAEGTGLSLEEVIKLSQG